MTFYLLVLNDGEDFSYSLWKTKQSAESEMKYLLSTLNGVNIYDFDIIELDAND